MRAFILTLLIVASGWSTGDICEEESERASDFCRARFNTSIAQCIEPCARESDELDSIIWLPERSTDADCKNDSCDQGMCPL